MRGYDQPAGEQAGDLGAEVKADEMQAVAWASGGAGAGQHVAAVDVANRGGATAARLAARRVSAARWRAGRGRRVTHPPTHPPAQAAPP